MDYSEWFESHYPGWIAEVRKRAAASIDKVACEKCSGAWGDMVSVPADIEVLIEPYMNDLAFGSWGWRVHSEDYPYNETDHGDKPQDWWMADKALGRFWINVETPIWVNCRDDCTYDWDTWVTFSDRLGFKKGEDGPLYKWLGWLFPDENVTRGLTQIDGKGSCQK
jgi:hypothetical protein